MFIKATVDIRKIYFYNAINPYTILIKRINLGVVALR